MQVGDLWQIEDLEVISTCSVMLNVVTQQNLHSNHQVATYGAQRVTGPNKI